MKAKLHRDLPWKPTCWVGGHGRVFQLSELDDETVEKYAASRVNAAILRAMRK